MALRARIFWHIILMNLTESNEVLLTPNPHLSNRVPQALINVGDLALCYFQPEVTDEIV